MPKEPEPGYIRMNPDDGHSVSFPDTSRGTDSPVEFAAHAFGVPTWGVEAANAIIDAATNVVGFEDGGLVGDPDITHDADDPEAAQRASSTPSATSNNPPRADAPPAKQHAAACNSKPNPNDARSK